jgi:hypothetical protein
MYLTGGFIMTQTVQLCSWASLSEADKELPIGKDLTKAEAEEKLKFLLLVYEIMSKISKDLDKLDYELKKTCIKLCNHYEKLKEGR